jgi:DNA-binding FrmR family transcriptional regulator
MAARGAPPDVAVIVDGSSKSHHDEVVRRLQRIEGQVSGICRMYEGGRYCIDVLDHISSARAGLQAAALLILEDHVNGCISEAIESGDGREKPTELLDAVRRFARSV